jgi:hypothetical protein
MNITRAFRAWLPLTALATLLCAAGTASADMVDITAGGWTGSSMARPTTLDVRDFAATTAGTVTLSTLDVYTLTGGKWGSLLDSLSTSISTAPGQTLQLLGNATIMFDIGANQRFTSSTYASANGGLGAYILDVRFTPRATEVPLPLGGWLLLSGVGLLVTRMRRPATSLSLAPA